MRYIPDRNVPSGEQIRSEKLRINLHASYLACPLGQNLNFIRWPRSIREPVAELMASPAELMTSLIAPCPRPVRLVSQWGV